MLSRTADNLFWMCRYVERAENTARMLSLNLHMSLLPRTPQAHDESWRATLRISELEDAYDERHERITPQDVVHFLVRDARNPSSIYSCLKSSRENARAVRGSLTTEVWETYNTTWLETVKHIQNGLLERNPEAFFEWVKFRSHLVRGVIDGTMLGDEALYFMQLGGNLERADNMARMLDVKFHEHADSNGNARPGSSNPAPLSEFYRWSALLAAVSGLEIYRKVYRHVITPERVVELLVLRGDMPRSLLATVKTVADNLERVSNQRSAETQRLAGRLCAELQYGRVEDILRGGGLHRYLETFLARINDLGDRISRDFLVPLNA